MTNSKLILKNAWQVDTGIIYISLFYLILEYFRETLLAHLLFSAPKLSPSGYITGPFFCPWEPFYLRTPTKKCLSPFFQYWDCPLFVLITLNLLNISLLSPLTESTLILRHPSKLRSVLQLLWKSWYSVCFNTFMPVAARTPWQFWLYHYGVSIFCKLFERVLFPSNPTESYSSNILWIYILEYQNSKQYLSKRSPGMKGLKDVSIAASWHFISYRYDRK